MVPLRTRLVRWCAALMLVGYWSALTVGTHLPNYATGPARYNDKLAHFGGYAGLALLACATWAAWRPFRLRSAAVVGCLCVAYGAVDELLQIPIPGRTGEWGDWLADATGAAVGIALFCCLRVATTVCRR